MKSASVHPFDLLLDIDSRCRGRQQSEAASSGEGVGGSKGRLALRVGDWRLTLDMDDVEEIIPVPQTTTVPGVKPWLLGIANLRGNVVSMVDLKQFFGGGVSVHTASSRIIVVRAEEWRYGLLVDEIIGMRHFNANDRAGRQVLARHPLFAYCDGVFSSEQQQWLAFNIDNLLHHSRFLSAAI